MKLSANFAVSKEEINLLQNHSLLGFESVDELFSYALSLLRMEIEERKKQQIIDSATLYAELYQDDEEANEWINSSNQDWK